MSTVMGAVMGHPVFRRAARTVMAAVREALGLSARPVRIIDEDGRDPPTLRATGYRTREDFEILLWLSP